MERHNEYKVGEEASAEDPVYHREQLEESAIVARLTVLQHVRQVAQTKVYNSDYEIDGNGSKNDKPLCVYSSLLFRAAGLAHRTYRSGVTNSQLWWLMAMASRMISESTHSPREMEP
jgi:hypothetical protein